MPLKTCRLGRVLIKHRPDVRISLKATDLPRRSEMTRCAKTCCEQVQQTAALFNHLVGADHKGLRHSETERLGRLEIDQQLNLVERSTGRSLGLSPFRMRPT